MGTDKKNIWDDCPACAYKHLTAAYALLTNGTPWGNFYVEAEIKLIARAVITCGEAMTGYLGNAALASGCLAAAEGSYAGHDDPEKAAEVRVVRMRLGAEPLTKDLFRAVRGLLPPDIQIEGCIAAHLAEAARELVDIEKRISELNSVEWNTNGTFVCFSTSRLAAELVPIIRDVEETYELGVRHDVP
jgi:hypothetical protein